jgi:hypothetical protein
LRELFVLQNVPLPCCMAAVMIIGRIDLASLAVHKAGVLFTSDLNELQRLLPSIDGRCDLSRGEKVRSTRVPSFSFMIFCVRFMEIARHCEGNLVRRCGACP